MKRGLLLLVSLCVFISFINAQIVECDPDPSCSEFFPGGGRICPEQLPDGILGEEYSEVITLIPLANFMIYDIISLRLDNITGLPEGLNWGKNTEVFTVTNPATRYCVSIYGIPEEAGEFPLTLYVTPTLNIGGEPTELDQMTDDTSVFMVVIDLSPVAAFSSDLTSSITESDVQFYDESTNDPSEWLWEFENGIPPTSEFQNPTIYWLEEGSYDVSLTVTNEYGSDVITVSDYITISNSVSLIGEDEDKIRIFPNPVTDILHIEAANIKKVSLMDIQGRQISKFDVNSDSFRVDLSNLNSGNYFLVVTVGAHTYIKNIAIK